MDQNYVPSELNGFCCGFILYQYTSDSYPMTDPNGAVINMDIYIYYIYIYYMVCHGSHQD